jgi:hypothetical protein
MPLGPNAVITDDNIQRAVEITKGAVGDTSWINNSEAVAKFVRRVAEELQSLSIQGRERG